MNTEPGSSTGRECPLVVVSTLGEPSVITVTGESDLDGIGALRAAVAAALDRHPHLVLDLGGVSFADSTLLTTLVMAHRTAAARAGSVRLLASSAAVRELLEISGTADLFPAAPDGQLGQP